MTENQILKELRIYLPPVFIYRIDGIISMNSFIQYCLVVADIVKQYDSTQENEDRVCFLLEELAKKQFNKRKS